MSKPEEEMVVEKKAELLREVRQALRKAEEDLESKKPDTDKLLEQAEAKQDKLLEVLNNQMRQFETEKAELGQKIQDITKEAEESLRLKTEAEYKADAALKEKSSVEGKLEELTAEKLEVEKKAETLLSEKTGLAEKIEALQAEKTELEGKAETLISEKAGLEKTIETLESEKAELETISETLRGEKEASEAKTAAALEESDKMKKTLLESVEDFEGKNEEVSTLKTELEKARGMAEAAENDRKLIQDQLEKFQENWERMIAGQ